MMMKGGMGMMIGRLLWYILHFAYLLFSSLCAQICSLRRAWRGRGWGGEINKVRPLLKTPKVVAVVVDSEEACTCQQNLVKLLKFLFSHGVQHVSLYDVQGALKLSKVSLEKRLNDELGGKLCTQSYKHELCCQNGKDTSSFEQPSKINLEFLSYDDGKMAIARATRQLCLDALQSKNLKKLDENDINKSLSVTGGMGPDPDVLFLFSEARCFLGFPPWRLRLTEVLFMGLLRNMTEDSLRLGLEEYSRKTHRYGK